jgi:signal transduction histidine kinase
VEAQTGEEALIKVHQTKPALMLLDVNMPGISGFEVCRRLQDNPDTRDITILFVSALGDLEHRMKGLTGGGVDYISKPFEPGEVLARVSTQLELHRLRSQLEERNKELEELVREKDRFLDLAAHGLRHPLLQIRGLIGLLRSGHLGEQGRETLVNTIAGASERMNHVLNDVLEVHDLETGSVSLNPEPVSVTALLKKCLELWRHRAHSRGVEIRAELGEVTEARHDPDKLTQVLETIVAQAVQSAPAGSTMTVKLSSDDERFRLTLSGWNDMTDSFSGLLSKAEKATPKTLGNWIIAKLVRHFGGSVALSNTDGLLLELPLRTGFSDNSSKIGRR